MQHDNHVIMWRFHKLYIEPFIELMEFRRKYFRMYQTINSSFDY